MGKRNTHSTKTSTANNAYYLVPGLLVFVALLQMFLAHTQNLTPWKGGGFGMFSVVDAPGMRFLNVQALDQEGTPILIETSAFLDPQRKRFIQSIPTQRQLHQLTSELMAQSYIPTGNPTLSAVQNFSRQNPELPIPSSMQNQGEWQVFRVKKATDPDLPNDQPRKLKAIRVQLWRVRFDANSHRVYSEPMLGPYELGAWP